MDIICLILIGLLWSLICFLCGCKIGHINGLSECKKLDDKLIEETVKKDKQ